MIIYEVNLTVNNSVAEQYEKWLTDHIREMLSFEGFISADWYEVEGSESNKSVWSIHYRLKNRESLENYFREHAQRMRQEGLRRFAGKFSAHRRILLQKENLSAEA